MVEQPGGKGGFVTQWKNNSNEEVEWKNIKWYVRLMFEDRGFYE